MTYDEALELLGTARDPNRGKPIGNNTRLLPRPGDRLAIRLHDTDIITYDPQGCVTLHSGGWRTRTTKSRINEFLPLGRIEQARGVWTWAYSNREHLYRDGMTITPDGHADTPTTTGPEADKTVKQNARLRRRVRDYSRLFVQQLRAGKIPAPTAGDCWGCLFRESSTNSPTVWPMGTDHLREHLGGIALKDKTGTVVSMPGAYYVPSLLVRALDWRASDAMRYAVAEVWQISEDRWGWAKQDAIWAEVERTLSRFLLLSLGLPN
jgi:hypothetical protein